MREAIFITFTFFASLLVQAQDAEYGADFKEGLLNTDNMHEFSAALADINALNIKVPEKTAQDKADDKIIKKFKKGKLTLDSPKLHELPPEKINELFFNKIRKKRMHEITEEVNNHNESRMNGDVAPIDYSSSSKKYKSSIKLDEKVEELRNAFFNQDYNKINKVFSSLSPDETLHFKIPELAKYMLQNEHTHIGLQNLVETHVQYESDVDKARREVYQNVVFEGGIFSPEDIDLSSYRKLKEMGQVDSSLFLNKYEQREGAQYYGPLASFISNAVNYISGDPEQDMKNLEYGVQKLKELEGELDLNSELIKGTKRSLVHELLMSPNIKGYYTHEQMDEIKERQLKKYAFLAANTSLDFYAEDALGVSFYNNLSDEQKKKFTKYYNAEMKKNKNNEMNIEEDDNILDPYDKYRSSFSLTLSTNYAKRMENFISNYKSKIGVKPNSIKNMRIRSQNKEIKLIFGDKSSNKKMGSLFRPLAPDSEVATMSKETEEQAIRLLREKKSSGDIIKTKLKSKGFKGKKEQTLLEMGIRAGSFDLVKLAVERGADVTQEFTIDGKTQTIANYIKKIKFNYSTNRDETYARFYELYKKKKLTESEKLEYEGLKLYNTSREIDGKDRFQRQREKDNEFDKISEYLQVEHKKAVATNKIEDVIKGKSKYFKKSELLLSDPTKYNNSGQTLLHDAIGRENERALKVFKNIISSPIYDKATNPNAKELDLNKKDVKGHTVMSLLIGSEYSEKDKIDTAELLIAKGMDINGVDNFGLPYVTQALLIGEKKLFHLFIDSGADVNQLDKNGMSVLHWAIVLKDKKAIEKILARHDVDISEREEAISLLELAGNSDIRFMLYAYAAKKKENSVNGFNGATYLVCPQGHPQRLSIEK